MRLAFLFTLLMYYFCRVTIFTNFSIRAIWFPVEILKKENKNEHMVRSMLVVLKNGEMIMILVASFITAAALATTSFVFIYLKQTFGVEKQILGLYGMSVACSVVLEVPIFFFAKQLSARFVLAFSLMKETDSAMTVCYWFLMGVILFAHSPGALFQILGFYFLLSLFTDLLFAPAWATMVTASAKKAPRGMEATAQARNFSRTLSYLTRAWHKLAGVA